MEQDQKTLIIRTLYEVRLYLLNKYVNSIFTLLDIACKRERYKNQQKGAYDFMHYFRRCV